MKATLRPGLTHRFTYRVPENKTVPHLYPEAADFLAMPHVLATGYFVGLLEWTCIQLLQPHLDAGEGSLGTKIDISHTCGDAAWPDRHRRRRMHGGGRTQGLVQRQGA